VNLEETPHDNEFGYEWRRESRGDFATPRAAADDREVS
jgi:hypothetical protein